MVACCIVERDTGRALLVRDRTGIKPLYLSSTGGRLRFASTIPALLAGGDISTDLDLVAVHHQLTLHGIVPAPRTLRSEEHTSELQSLMRISYAVFCLKKKKKQIRNLYNHQHEEIVQPY